jgi:hypothetical protein
VPAAGVAVEAAAASAAAGVATVDAGRRAVSSSSRYSPVVADET